MELARVMQGSSLCALGQSVIVPLGTIMQHFQGEIQAHLHGCCPTGKCSPAGATSASAS
jgi:NADH:ubiquinone oxidoreductase subunit F (NADH-binding)